MEVGRRARQRRTRLFGLKISEGAIANMLARTAEPMIASDETSARVEGKTYPCGGSQGSGLGSAPSSGIIACN